MSSIGWLDWRRFYSLCKAQRKRVFTAKACFGTGASWIKMVYGSIG